jgi:hypothetical protein
MSQFGMIPRISPCSLCSYTYRISIDELKKLARVWKLNEQRNFWKQHFTKHALLNALVQHVRDMQNNFSGGGLNTNDDQSHSSAAVGPQSSVVPAPPSDIRPSFAVGPETSRPRVKVKFRKICGYPDINNTANESTILTKSRHKGFPNDENVLAKMLINMRTSDITSRPADSVSSREAARARELAPGKSMSTIIKNEKQRALALQLLEFSLKQTAYSCLTRQQVETYLCVCDTDDDVAIEYIGAALSNICSNPATRALLIELNALHKYSGLLPSLKTPAAIWSATLFFYYLTCENDLEDRIYNAGFGTLMNSSMSKDPALAVASLGALANLLPCSDRHRIAEQILRSTMNFGIVYFSTHPEELRSVLRVILKALCFLNIHITLINLDIIDFLSILIAQQDRNDVVVGRLLSEILSSLLQSPEFYEDLVEADYIRIFLELLAFEDDQIMQECVRAITVLSGEDSTRLAVRDPSVVEVLCGIVQCRHMSEATVMDIAKYFANICCVSVPHQIIDVGLFKALLTLLDKFPLPEVRTFCLRAMRGILKSPAHCIRLCDACAPVLIKAIQAEENLEAITCLQYLSSVQVSIPKLFSHGVHTQILEILNSPKLSELPIGNIIGYFRILLQMISGSSERAFILLNAGATECIWYVLQGGSAEKDAEADAAKTLLNAGLSAAERRRQTAIIKKSQENAESAKFYLNPEVCTVVSRLLVCLIVAVGREGAQLPTSTRQAALDVVHLIGRPQSSEAVLDECALVLASTSASGVSYDVADPIIRRIMSPSCSDVMLEAISVVVFNMTCIPENIEGILSDDYYLNLMIRMMRSGLIAAQDNIVDAFRTLCCYSECSKLLLERDLLSDFIVVALLRSSSARIKTACCESLYNMLSQSEGIRHELVRGDLWWAVMRLTKTDVERIRKVCCSALLNLSLEAECIPALRHHHVIGFLKEFTTAGNGPFLEPCLVILYNVLYHSNSPLQSSEIVMAAVLCIQCITRCDTPMSISLVLHMIARLLQMITELNIPLIEIANTDMARLIMEAKAFWISDANCRETVSLILQLASRHATFVNAVPLSDIVPVCEALLNENQDPGKTSDLALSSSARKDGFNPFADALLITQSIVERETIACVLMEYLFRLSHLNLPILRHLIRQGLFHSVVTGPLCSSRIPGVKMVMSRAITEAAVGEDSTDSKDVKEIWVSEDLRLTSLALYGSTLPLLIAEAEGRSKETTAAWVGAEGPTEGQSPSAIVTASSQTSWFGVIPVDLCTSYTNDAESLANIVFIIGAYSHNRILSSYLLESELSTFLRHLMSEALLQGERAREDPSYRGTIFEAFALSRKASQQSQSRGAGGAHISASAHREAGAEQAQVWAHAEPSAVIAAARFCSAMLRNVSSHPHLMPQLIEDIELDHLVLLLAKTNDIVVIRDLALVLFRCANEELSKDMVLSPQAVLDAAAVVCRSDNDPSILRLYRFIVANVLENFSSDIGPDPDNVRSIYDEMVENDGVDVTAIFNEWTFDDRSLYLHPVRRSHVAAPSPIPVTLPQFPPVDDLWTIIRDDQLKQLHSVAGASLLGVPPESIEAIAENEKLFTLTKYPIEKEPPRPLAQYKKTICTYPAIDTSVADAPLPSMSNKRASIKRLTSKFDPYSPQHTSRSSIGFINMGEIDFSKEEAESKATHQKREKAAARAAAAAYSLSISNSIGPAGATSSSSALAPASVVPFPPPPRKPSESSSASSAV